MKNVWIGGLLVLLASCGAGIYLTRDATAPRADAKGAPAAVLDERLLVTARQMLAQADTPEGLAFGREAMRLADHEYDQAYASALRELVVSPPAAASPLRALVERIAALKAKVAAGQKKIDELSKRAGASEEEATKLEFARSLQALDQDDLVNAQEELARKGGDPRSNLQRTYQQHQAAGQVAAAQSARLQTPPAVGTMLEQWVAWTGLGVRSRQLTAAAQQAEGRMASLTRRHDMLAKLILNGKSAAPVADGGEPPSIDDADEDPEVILALLKQLSDQRKTLVEVNKRLDDCQQLAGIYRRWVADIDKRRMAVLHLLLRSLLGVLLTVLAVVLVDRTIRHAFRRQKDHKRLHQMRVMATIATQLVGAGVIALILFGPPNQTSTIIGLATAGLTVVLKDFIVAFFGWFALLGRNGIRVGDWVEIEGVSGEVVEIGVLKTVLLEMGHWGNSGHPTGRRVAFVNKFAIENHYFNFSTAGQWLWDELELSLPSTGDAYRMAIEIRELVEKETADEAVKAEREWERVTHQYGTRPFSARPAVDLRPSSNGLDVVVRYIAHAPDRAEVKSRLLQRIVTLVHSGNRPGIEQNKVVS